MAKKPVEKYDIRFIPKTTNDWWKLLEDYREGIDDILKVTFTEEEKEVFDDKVTDRDISIIDDLSSVFENTIYDFSSKAWTVLCILLEEEHVLRGVPEGQ